MVKSISTIMYQGDCRRSKKRRKDDAMKLKWAKFTWKILGVVVMCAIALGGYKARINAMALDVVDNKKNIGINRIVAEENGKNVAVLQNDVGYIVKSVDRIDVSQDKLHDKMDKIFQQLVKLNGS